MQRDCGQYGDAAGGWQRDRHIHHEQSEYERSRQCLEGARRRWCHHLLGWELEYVCGRRQLRPPPPDLYWGQRTGFNSRLIQEINNESREVDLIVYRLEVSNLMQALLNKHKAGIPVKLIIDPAQYTNDAWPQVLADARQPRHAVRGGRSDSSA